MEITQNKCRLNTILHKNLQNCIKIRQNDYKSKKMSKTRQKFDFGMEPKVIIQHPHASRSLLCIRFVAIAFQSEAEVC